MLKADYFDGRSSRRQSVSLAIQGSALVLQGEFGRRSEPLAGIDIAEAMGAAPRTLRFADGSYCEVRDGAALDRLMAAAGIQPSAVVNAQTRWPWALAALASMIMVIAAGYLWGLPWLGRTLAPRIPESFSQSISAATLKAIDGRVLRPSNLAEARRRGIAVRVEALAAQAGSLPPHRLLFRASPKVGPNAFALPNGDVVILDELVALARDDQDIAAVVAHELGHVHHRHGLRQMIQSTVVSFIVGAYFGDISSVAAGLGALVLESNYSREFESEADAYGARALLAAGGTVEPLAHMLSSIETEHLKRAGQTKGQSGGAAGFLSSHPETAARIAALLAMATH